MTNLDFGPLVLGGNTFGWSSDRDESFAVLDAFVDAGGRSIDTADVYSEWAPGNTGGDSERILGEWFSSRGRRDDVVLATKVSKASARPGLSRATIRAAVDESLERLQTDRIDLYYAHADDDDVEQAEYVAAFGELVAEGKIVEVGASNFTPDRLRSAIALASDAGTAAFTVSQDPFNLVARDIEHELLPTIRELGLVELPYSGLASGFLSGKYRPGQQVDSVRAGGASRYLDDQRSMALLESVDRIADDRGVSVAAVSLAWLRQQPGVAAPIASARIPSQLAELQQSFGLELTDEELAGLA